MSRNYELMQGMMREQAFLPHCAGEPAFPVSREIRHRSAPGAGSELTQGLVQRLFLRPMKERPRTVVFAAIDHGNGCSQIAAAAAESLAANAPNGVCLVEANFRSPGLAERLGTTNFHGLSNALLEAGSVRSFAKPFHQERLWLLSSGPLTADSPKLLALESMRLRMGELRREFDFVVVDAPPMVPYADALALGRLADGVVLVLEARATRREAARQAVESLRAARIELLGAVLNKRTFPIPERIYRRL